MRKKAPLEQLPVSRNQIEVIREGLPYHRQAQYMEQEAKVKLILEQFAQGKPMKYVVDYVREVLGCSISTAQTEVEFALQYLKDDKTIDSMVSANKERLESIISKAMENGQDRVAIKAIDTQNKMLGAYEEKVKVESDVDVTFEFNI